MVAPAVAAAAASAGADLLGGAFSAKNARDESRRNRDFQLYMSNTAYQRAVTDMRAAGINPILAAKMGGASTGPGAMASMPDFSKIGSSAMQAGAQSSVASASVDKIEEETRKVGLEADNAKFIQSEIKARTDKLLSEGRSLDYDNIAKAIISKYQQDNPNQTIMQSFGIDGKTLSGKIIQILTGLYGSM